MTTTPEPKSESESELEQMATAHEGGLLREYIDFLRTSSKWYLLPIIVAMVLLGALIFIAGSSAAPFIYALF